ncbi:MAG: hypothetical protein ABW152_12820 [Candidatus Thiodiazotropha endolucinida]
MLVYLDSVGQSTVGNELGLGVTGSLAICEMKQLAQGNCNPDWELNGEYLDLDLDDNWRLGFLPHSGPFITAHRFQPPKESIYGSLANHKT